MPYYNSDDSDGQGFLNQNKSILIGASKCKTSSGDVAKIYRPQIGQKYYFDDITVDVMFTHEQLDSTVWKNNANETSTWLRFNIDGKTFVHCGDGQENSIKAVTEVYDAAFLDFDVITTPHHAQHITDDYVNTIISEDTKVLYTTFITDTQSKYYSEEENEALRAKVGEGNYICWGNGTVVVTFNEGVTWTTQDSRDWTWHPDRNNNPPTQYIGNPIN